MPEAGRVGLGFDVHPQQVGRPLMLAGIRFDEDEGLAGHSDGDAVCHALADAMLGAAALGDVGTHFPDTDPAMRGISGLDLLARTVGLVGEAEYSPRSCDVTVLCDQPAIAPRRDEMRRTLAEVLSLDLDRVSVKATRPEGLGLHGDGVGCMAVVVLDAVEGRS